MEHRLSQQKKTHDQRAKERCFEEGQKVYVKNYRGGQRWLPGSIEKVTGPLSFHVKLTNGQTVRCHQDQLRHREAEGPPVVNTDDFGTFPEVEITEQANTSHLEETG